MQRLVVVLVALLAALVVSAPLPARAQVDVDLPETKVEGTVQAGPAGTGIAGLPAGARVEAKWETTNTGSTAGKECEVKNVTNPLAVTRAKGLTGVTTTNAPSNHLACNIAKSNIAGIVPPVTLCVDVNFSNSAATPPDGDGCTNTTQIPSNRWRVRSDGSATAVVTSTIRELEVDPGDD